MRIWTLAQFKVLRFVTGLFTLLALVPQAHAQKGGGFETPTILVKIPPPDLEIAVTAPAQIAQATQGTVQVKVDNPLVSVTSWGGGSTMLGSPAKGVNVSVRLVGLEAIAVQAQGSSGLQCALGWGNRTVYCWGGTVPAGGAASISITVRETGDECRDYCSSVYVDAIVDGSNTIAERSETNNRALSVMDVINCLN